MVSRVTLDPDHNRATSSDHSLASAVLRLDISLGTEPLILALWASFWSTHRARHLNCIHVRTQEEHCCEECPSKLRLQQEKLSVMQGQEISACRDRCSAAACQCHITQ